MSDAARVFLSRGLVATLTLDQWRLFIQIADLGSLTKVAALRDGAQSAVSRQLAAMEQTCGGRLFLRTGRGVALTEAGRRLYPRVLAWLEAGEALGQDLARQVEQPAGQVASACCPRSIRSTCRAPIWLSRRYPGIRLRVRDGVGAAVDSGWRTARSTSASAQHRSAAAATARCSPPGTCWSARRTAGSRVAGPCPSPGCRACRWCWPARPAPSGARWTSSRAAWA